MTILSAIEAVAAPDALERLRAGLGAHGLAIVDDWLPRTLVDELTHTCRALATHGHLAPAGIGQGTFRVKDEDWRQAGIRWIEAPFTGAEQAWLEHCEALRVGLNSALWLGLFDLESHYAAYPVGGFYRRHSDRFRTDDRRVVSLVLYLDDAWSETDGGALRFYRGDADRSGFLDVYPAAGRCVAFLSARYAHEVLATGRERHAIAAWFRRRPVDPIVEI
jgi:SM-20-related protein